MNKISFKYSIAGCFKVFVRSPIMALAALCLLFGSLLIFSFTYAVTHNIDAISENEGKVSILLSDECDENGVAQIRDKLAALGTVSEIDYLSKSEALENQKQRYPESGLFGTFTSEKNPFRASFTVNVGDDTGYSEVKNAVKDLKFEKTLEDGTVYSYDPIYKVHDDREAIQKIENAGDKLVGSLGIIIPAMLVVCIVLISAVVRIGIFDQREEISLMRITGATHTYISAQFIFEGLTLGLLSSVLAIVLLKPMYNALISKVAQSVKLFTPLPFSEIAPGVIVFCVIFGLLAGLLGSLVATARYIKRD